MLPMTLCSSSSIHWPSKLLSQTETLSTCLLPSHLPEFAECHWDHWLLDVFGCNFIGSWLGMRLCKVLLHETRLSTSFSLVRRPWKCRTSAGAAGPDPAVSAPVQPKLSKS
jgi:hypothetical protein